MKLTEIAIFTADVDRVAAFYEGLLKSPADRVPGEKAVFDMAGITVLIHKREEPMPGYPPDEDHLAYAVDNLDDACRDLAQGFRLEREPKTYPWGRSAYLRDPDGRLLELHEQGA